ncbi:hypothetical protein C2W58_00895 [Bacillus pumilus]|uniref:Uncharacterized protein n=1 Tax=Bacillus pumilus TaxID=1408 RepID=A0AB34QWB2_BACPU|nr:hypothetical protein B4127_1323 [Bacillus pumilus]RAP08839.1 hypothetical protein C2W58_00895 [Bacillus pumilus]
MIGFIVIPSFIYLFEYFIILMKRDMILKIFYALFSFSSKRKRHPDVECLFVFLILLLVF